MSLAKTVKACTQQKIDIEVACIAGSSVVTWARSKVLDTFLKGTSGRLFWIDSDIVWEPRHFLRMLALSSRYPVICACYAQKTDAQTIVIRHPDLKTLEINSHGLAKVQGAGLGFTVITREVAERLAESKPLIYDPAGQCNIRDVFRLDTVDRGHEFPDCRHEDVAFFADLIDLGYDVLLDVTIQLGHVGSKVYTNNPITALGIEHVLGRKLDGTDELSTAVTP